MKLITSLFITSIIIPTVAQTGCPDGIRTRPNYLTMSQADRDKFHNAIKILNTQEGGNLYQNFTAIHIVVGSGAHGSPGFFTWHRKFIREFEKALQSIDSSIMLPYWDWTRDSQAPERSQIFANNNMGPNGGTGSGGCIQTGTFSGWRVQSTNGGCVRRYFANGRTIPSWTAPEILNSYLNTQQSYDRFRQQIEGTGHALVHTGIGGQNGDMSFMYSTNDPIFWLHHGFIDLIWYEWQQRNPSRANDYPTNPSTTRLFTYGDLVSSTFDTTSSEYCYIYPRWTVNAPSVDPNTLPATTTTGSTELANPFESCPSDQLGTITGCRSVRRSLDIASLLSKVPLFPGYVSPEDRTTSLKIRVPARVPASYLKMNGIDPATALQDYVQSAIIACKLNLLRNFKPLARL